MFGSLAFRLGVRRQVFHVPVVARQARALDFDQPASSVVSVSLAERTVRVMNPCIKWVITALQRPKGPHPPMHPDLLRNGGITGRLLRLKPGRKSQVLSGSLRGVRQQIFGCI